MSPDKNILIFRPGSIGDTIISLPALHAIRRFYGINSHITLAHELAPSKEIAPDSILSNHTCVDEFICYVKSNSLICRIKYFKKIREKKFDVVIYLVPSRWNPILLELDRFFYTLVGIKKKIGFVKFSKLYIYPEDSSGRPAKVKHESLFLLDRLLGSGITNNDDFIHPNFDIELSESELENGGNWLEKYNLNQNKYLIAIAPGTNQPANQWPEDRFSLLGSKLLEDYKCELIVIGGQKDFQIAELLINYWGTGINATGISSPRISAALLKFCKIFIGLDSGPLHLAMSVGIPTVSLFSDRDNPGRWHPLGKEHKVIRKSVKCGGCRKKICPLPGHPCMNNIYVDEVIENIKLLLSTEK